MPKKPKVVCRSANVYINGVWYREFLDVRGVEPKLLLRLTLHNESNPPPDIKRTASGV